LRAVSPTDLHHARRHYHMILGVVFLGRMIRCAKAPRIDAISWSPVYSSFRHSAFLSTQLPHLDYLFTWIEWPTQLSFLNCPVRIRLLADPSLIRSFHGHQEVQIQEVQIQHELSFGCLFLAFNALVSVIYRNIPDQICLHTLWLLFLNPSLKHASLTLAFPPRTVTEPSRFCTESVVISLTHDFDIRDSRNNIVFNWN
jgi:hypothetical protein